ncbi:MAG TPA: ATP-binding cassette domain-containing protein [bacterium]|nr:ATP-binding cassette domain-containing protein [bacterium]
MSKGLPGTAVQISGLVKRFKAFTAVDHLSLTIAAGEIFGLLGPNGSGKTTTVNVITGLASPTAGDVTILGLQWSRKAREIRRCLGCVPQETALFDELSAWANLDFHADLYGVPRQGKRARIQEMLDLVQLSDRRSSAVGTFSGGMKRRLALARALLHDPLLVCLDEPTLGVDVQSREALWSYIRDLKTRGKTVVVTTNYLEEAQALCDRIAIIDHGKLVALDTPDALRRRFGGAIVELETARPWGAWEELRAIEGVQQVTADGVHLRITAASGSRVVPQVINRVVQAVEISDIRVHEPDLSEAFLALTGTALRD